MIERHEMAEDERKAKLINKVRSRLAEMAAYQKVLDDYKADNLTTLKWGFKPAGFRPNTPHSFKRFKFETRIYHAGYSIQTLKPEVQDQIEKNKPMNRKEALHKKLLLESRYKSNFMIDRRLTNAAMKNEQH